LLPPPACTRLRSAHSAELSNAQRAAPKKGNAPSAKPCNAPRAAQKKGHAQSAEPGDARSATPRDAADASLRAAERRAERADLRIAARDHYLAAQKRKAATARTGAPAQADMRIYTTCIARRTRTRLDGTGAHHAQTPPATA